VKPVGSYRTDFW